jgi:hypothetical protein
MDDLHEIEAIKRLKYRYMRCLDQKRWVELAECFTEDAETAYGGGRYAFRGRDAVMRFLEESMGAASFLSSHRVHHPEIDLTGPAAARGTWALEDVVIDSARNFYLQGAAFYEDEYAKAGDVWRIRRTGYVRTFEFVEPLDRRPGFTLTVGDPQP